MRNYLQTLRPAIILGIGLTMALIGAAFGSTGSHADPGAVAVYQAATATPTAAAAASRSGSTDGIMLMGLIIVIIILIPIALRRNTWTR